MSLLNAARDRLRPAVQWWRRNWGRPFSGPTGRWCRRRVERLPAPAWPDKPPHPLPLVMLCGRAQIPLLCASLRSILRHWARLPALRIVTDGGCAPAEIARSIAWWRGPLEVVDFETHCRPVRGSHPRVWQWAARAPMGRKLAFELAFENFPVLYADTDVLWFRELPDETDASRRSAPLTAAADQFASYAPELLAGPAAELAAPPHVNAGVALFRAGLDSLVDVEPLLAVSDPNEPHHLAEQTIVALAARRRGAWWSLEEIAMNVWDAHRLRPSYRGRPWLARHYTSPVRDLFWRDAWWLLSRGVSP